MKNKSICKFLLFFTLNLFVIFFVGCKKEPEIIKYNVNFLVNDEVYYSVQSAGNESISIPSNPYLDGYNFVDWYLDDETFEKQYTSNYFANTKIESDINIYSKFLDNSEVFLINENRILGVKDPGQKLNHIVVPEGIVEIGDFAFYGCNVTKSISIPESVVKIAEQAFKGCEKIESLILPFVGTTSSDEIAGKETLFGAIFGKESFKDAVKTTQYYSSEGSEIFYIPKTLKNVTILNGNIYFGSFYNCSNLTNIYIKGEGEIIGENAFYNCSNLKRIDLPENINKIGANAFNKCTKLATVNIQDLEKWMAIDFENKFSNPLNYSRKLYKNNKQVSKIVISEGSIDHISSFALYNCTSVNSITINSNINKIGENAFYGCTSLSSIYIDDLDMWLNIEFNDEYSNPMFYAEDFYVKDNQINKLEISDNITKINDYAFYKFHNLESVKVPTSIISIGKNSFYECNSIKSVYIDSIESWVNIAFEGENSNPLTFAHNLYLNENKIVDLVIPREVDSISNYAFNGMTSLQTLILPIGLEKIGDYSFSGCSKLKIVDIPESVTKIGLGAFAKCSAITAITVPFIGGEKDAEESGENTLFGYIFGTAKYTGGTEIKQYYTASKYSKFYIPSSLKEITILGGIMNFGSLQDCKNLTKVEVGDKVTSIGAFAFNNCTALTDIKIGTAISSIGEKAFYNCTSLTRISLPRSIKSIGKDAFLNCNKFTYFNIASLEDWLCISLENEYSNPLAYAHSLYINNELQSELTIPSSIKIIPDYVFYGCGSIAKIETSNGVESIGVSAFENCGNLKYITLSQSIVEICKSAFKDCTSLIDVDIPSGVTTIGDSVFSGCMSLIEIVIPNSVKTMGKEVFYKCRALVKLTIPFVGSSIDNVTPSNETLFGYIFGTTKYDIGKEIVQYYNTSKSVKYYLPASLREVVVNGGRIFYGAFYNCNLLTNITLSDDVKYIGTNAFYGCSGVEYNTYGSGKYVGSVTNKYFALVETDDKDIKSITINENCRVIAGSVFANYASLSNISLGNNIESIGDNAFINCTSLTSLVIPNSVSYIGEAILNGCGNLINLTIPFIGAQKENQESSDTALFGYLFGTKSYTGSASTNQSYASSKTKTYYIPKTLESVTVKYGNLTYGAFSSCSYIKNITILEGTNNIGDYAFNNCTSLESITLPNNIETIGQRAFNGCSKLKSFNMPSSLKTIEDYAFNGCGSLTQVTFNNKLETIGSNAFNSCSKLSAVTIPSSVTFIGINAFTKCGLTSVQFDSYDGWIVCKMVNFDGYETLDFGEENQNTTALNYLKSKYVAYYWKKS